MVPKRKKCAKSICRSPQVVSLILMVKFRPVQLDIEVTDLELLFLLCNSFLRLEICLRG